MTLHVRLKPATLAGVTQKPRVRVSSKLKRKSKRKTGPLGWGKSSSVPPVSELKEALECPVCKGEVDPRRTTQALSRNGRLLLFCSSGCLRQFLAAERDKA